MAKFEDKLDAKISEVLNEAKLSDELYKKYVQYVGALEALPQEQIAIDRLGSDIHDQFGRVKPFSQWPTKAVRAKSEKVWLNYNQRLQLKQAAKEAGLEGDPEDPTDDPDFLGQLLDTCVRTSMQMGLDKQTAFRHCSRQVNKFEQSIRGALTDRGLPKKEVEEFTKELLRGMANGKQIDMKDLSVEDRQFIQDLKDSITYKPKSESIIREALDDKDTFRPECIWYDCQNRPDSDTFHRAHVDAFRAVVHGPATGKFSDLIQREMAKFGYYLLDTGRAVTGGIPFDSRDWTLKEDLDDKDEFTKCFMCSKHPGMDQHFHFAHTAASSRASKQCKAKFTSTWRALTNPYVDNKEYSALFKKLFNQDMVRYGYTNENGHWVKTIKEDLDDKDEFGEEGCSFCNFSDVDPYLDEAVFHFDHQDVDRIIHNQWLEGYRTGALDLSLKELYDREMVKRGYARLPEGQWITQKWNSEQNLKEGHHYGGEYLEDAPESITIGDLELKVGDWIELGPVAKSTPEHAGEGLDDTDKFGNDEDWPITPVQIVAVWPGGTYAYRNSPPHIAQYIADYGVPPMRFVVTLSNSEMLALPDKSGVRWHGRPKHFVPAWYETWWKKCGDDLLTRLHQDGELRKVDNIQKWFHIQPEK